LLTPPAEAAASQKWKIIYLQVLRHHVCETIIAGDISDDRKKVDFADFAIMVAHWLEKR